ncbi:MAG TPA: hypothetical protein EYH22_01165 [Candidatus Nanopusillus sp.]|nr:hypothetical protein [Candidatus Nanopusillus sp.]
MDLGKKIIYIFKITVAVILSLLVFMILFKLVYYIFNLLYANPLERFEPINVKNMLGDILLVFVLIELLRTVYIYVANPDVYLNALVEAALVAVLRKIILVEVEKLDPLYMLSLAVLFVCMSLLYLKMQKQDQ